MRVKSIQGIALAGAAAAMLAGCSGGGAAAAPPAPATSTVGTTAPAARPAPAPKVEPAPERQPKTEPAPERKPARPVVGAVTTTPRLACDGGWCTVPAGPGTVTFTAQVTGAHRVEFFLVPTGTDTWSLRRSLGTDREGADGWAVTWAYGEEPLMHHLVVQARGPGGTVQESPLNLVRE